MSDECLPRRAVRLLVGSATVFSASVASGQEQDRQGSRRFLEISANPVNLMREIDPAAPEKSGYYEEYVEALAEVPTFFCLGGGTRAGSLVVRLRDRDLSWADQIDISIRKDGLPTDGRMVLVEPSVCMGSITSAPVAPGAHEIRLEEGEVFDSLWRLEGRSGGLVDPGLYQIDFRAQSTAEAFFGLPVVLKVEYRILVRRAAAGDELRLAENVIERHYTTGVALKPWDEPGSTDHLQTARRLVEELLRSGAGDEEGLFNITPRYQAARIYAALEMYDQVIAYYTRVIQGTIRESKMRHAHFSRERGTLPMPYAQNLTRAMKQIRMKQALAAEGKAAPSGTGSDSP